VYYIYYCVQEVLCLWLAWLVVCLQGTLDCILCGASGEGDAAKALATLHTNLKSPGTLLMFSHSPPVQRMALIQSCPWASVQVTGEWGWGGRASRTVAWFWTWALVGTYKQLFAQQDTVGAKGSRAGE
jgi:hypothetical protein